MNCPPASVRAARLTNAALWSGKARPGNWQQNEVSSGTGGRETAADTSPIPLLPASRLFLLCLSYLHIVEVGCAPLTQPHWNYGTLRVNSWSISSPDTRGWVADKR